MRTEALDLYRKTFLRIQTVILLVTFIVYATTDGHWRAAGVFFVCMQLFAWLGASWGMRLVRFLSKAPAELPLRAKR